MDKKSEINKNLKVLSVAAVFLLLILASNQFSSKITDSDNGSVETRLSYFSGGPGVGAVIPASCPSFEHTPGECTPPSTDIKANGSDGPVMVEYNKSANISWSSTNASSCSISPTGWTGTSGSQSLGPVTENIFLTITCSGPGGSASDGVSIVVVYPAPKIVPYPGGVSGGGGTGGGGVGGSGGGGSGEKCTGFCATPSTIGPGGSSILSWSSTNATSCSINQGVGPVPTTGTKTVSPLATTEYTLTCTGLGGTATAKTIVTVLPVPKFKEVLPD